MSIATGDNTKLSFSAEVIPLMIMFRRLLASTNVSINSKAPALNNSSLKAISNWRYVDDSVSQTDPLVTKYYEGILAGQRAALAKGITLVESSNPRKKAMGK